MNIDMDTDMDTVMHMAMVTNMTLAKFLMIRMSDIGEKCIHISHG
jgi:hypothetical protein